MKLLSVNVALPREVQINGQPVLTGIYKQPVSGPVSLRRLTLAGDGQADLTVHGGEYQAAYTYPFEHYAHWEKSMGVTKYPPGTFGENFTTFGLLETEICIGDTLRIGDAVVQVTMPRLPCFKFAHKMGRPGIIKEFLHSGFSGFYHRVLKEGTVQAGDTIEWVEREPHRISVREILGLQRLKEGNPAHVRRALEIECLPPSLREDLEARLAASEEQPR
jgi:MOSC domain-containing protein YiiM